MKSLFNISAAILLLTNTSTYAADTISVDGLESDNLGVAGWNVIGAGSEPIAVAHDLPWTPDGGNDRAFYYIASREYGGIDAMGLGAIKGGNPVNGFSSFITSLGIGGYTIDDVTVSFGLMTLGTDTQGVEWDYNAGTTLETRHYNGGTFSIKLDGHNLVSGLMPTLHMNLLYNNVADPFDDQISGITDFANPSNASGGSPLAVQNAASTFIQDVNGNGIQLVFDSFQPAVVDFQFSGNGRVGAFFEAQSGVIATPEPTTALTLLTGSCILAFRRRRA